MKLRLLNAVAVRTEEREAIVARRYVMNPVEEKIMGVEKKIKIPGKNHLTLTDLY